MDLLINLIPVIVVLIILFRRKHMLVAGLAGGIIAVLIGGLQYELITTLMIEGVGNMLSILVPILYAATATMVAKGGSIHSLVELAQRSLKGKISILAGMIVLIQGFATYAAGTAAGNSMVTAPLMAIAVGAVPEVIAAMAIVSAVGFTTAPSSTETALAAESAGIDVVTHANNMIPFTILFYLVGISVAIYGVYKRGHVIGESKNSEMEFADLSINNLVLRSIPFIALLLMVVFGGTLNNIINFPLLTPPIIVILTSILTYVFSPMDINETSEALVEGSRFILTTLFSVGIFLGFINMIAEIGTFEQLASLAGQVPDMIVLPVAIVLSFLIAIPSGAFAAGVLALILPTLATLGLPSEAMGFVAVATGLGTQVSPVQINVAALAEGFDLDIIAIVKNNVKYTIIMLVLTIITAVVFV